MKYINKPDFHLPDGVAYVKCGGIGDAYYWSVFKIAEAFGLTGTQ